MSLISSATSTLSNFFTRKAAEIQPQAKPGAQVDGAACCCTPSSTPTDSFEDGTGVAGAADFPDVFGQSSGGGSKLTPDLP